jgi:hypothetical protein
MKPIFIYIASCLNLLMFCFYLFSFSGKNKQNATLDYSDKIIKVRGVVVVDSLGIERVIVGSPLFSLVFNINNKYKTLGKLS